MLYTNNFHTTPRLRSQIKARGNEGGVEPKKSQLSDILDDAECTVTGDISSTQLISNIVQIKFTFFLSHIGLQLELDV